MKSHCVILARGGSKGLPNKNIKKFCGKPLIYWTISQSLNSKCFEEVWVSSDSDKILQISKKLERILLKDQKNFPMIPPLLRQLGSMHYNLLKKNLGRSIYFFLHK